MTKILILSNIEWANTNSFGNTISNFFTGFDASFACIYRRSSLPNNDLCTDYYTITTKDCIKNFFSKEKVGKAFTLPFAQMPKSTFISGEKKLISLIHRFNLSFVRRLDDWIFCHCKWNNQKFRDYILAVQPDVVFTFITTSEPSLQIMRSIKKIYPKCKFIASIVDDVYGVSNRKERGWVEEQIRLCDRLYGASEELCAEYASRFKKIITPLYKGCTFINDVKKKPSSPIHIVYAGNLHYGRADTLASLATAIHQYNLTGAKKIFLSIYSNTVIDKTVSQKLNIDGAATVYTAKPYHEIMQIMEDAHIVLHVESFEPKETKVIRYSFSTKIIDCFQSGSVMMAIGPDSASSIKYVQKAPGTICITALTALSEILKRIGEMNLYEMALQTRTFALNHHSSEALCKQLTEEFQSTLSET